MVGWLPAVKSVKRIILFNQIVRMNGEKLQLIVYEKRVSRFCTLF